MHTSIQLGKTSVELVRKDIKNVNLSVNPPTGKVRISAPMHMKSDTIRLFAISKLGWIKRNQKKMLEQERENRRDFIERESHYLWGQRVLLGLQEENTAPAVHIHHNRLLLKIRPNSSREAKEQTVAHWYRKLIKNEAPKLIEKYEKILNIKVNQIYVQKMKTKWGSCNSTARTIRLNTELAKKPKICLEYLIAHEMVHLLDHTHGPKFVEIMDQIMPAWREIRENLNRLPAKHENWIY